MTGIQRNLVLVAEPRPDINDEEQRIAFATSDMRRVNEHFGTARRFAIYRIDAHCARLERVVDFDPARQDGNEDKLGPRLAALAGCRAIHCRAIGASAVRQLLQHGVKPVRWEEEPSIEMLVADIQRHWGVSVAPLRQAPPPGDPGRMIGWLSETWEE
ncbi:MAG: NifB/NifX family molybdenum-iron cluster-binding protein [Magnetococcus sp. WYHC-3]